MRSWLASKIAGDEGYRDRDRDRDRDRGRDRERDRDYHDHDRGRDRRRRDDMSDEEDDRDRRRGGGRDRSRDRGRDRDRGRGHDRDGGRERFDDLSDDDDSYDRGRGQHRRDDGRRDRRREREEARAREREEELAKLDRLSPAERERLARVERERERERRSRYQDKDEEEDRRRELERERERQADEDAREALKAEEEMVNISEALPAEDAFKDTSGSTFSAPKQDRWQYQGEISLASNSESWHVSWSLVKTAIFFGLFLFTLYVRTGDFSVLACDVSEQVGWCLSTGPIYPGVSGVNILCQDRVSSSSCDGQCQVSRPISEARSNGCAMYWCNTGSTLSCSASDLPAPLPGDLQIQEVTTTPDPATAPTTCLSPDDFDAACNDRQACDPKWLHDVQKGYVPSVAMFFIMALMEVLYGGGLIRWMGVHTDEYGMKLRHSRLNRYLLYYVRFHPKASQIASLILIICWVFLYLGWKTGSVFCADAVNDIGMPLTVFRDTRNFLIAFVFIVLAVIGVGTWVRKTKPVRGELFIPSFSDELTPPCNMDFKDMRERPPPRCCPECFAEWEEPDSDAWCTCCAKPCKHLTNFLFSLLIAPIGFLIEMFFRHRHFIGP